MEINDIIDKLFDYFKVTSIQDLAEKMNVSQPTISKWKTRNAMSAIKKRCRELGIHNEIFGDLNSNISNFHNSNINKAFDLSSNSHSRDSINIGNNPICEIILKMNQTIVSSFIGAYKKLEEDKELKRLYDILGELEFEKRK